METIKTTQIWVCFWRGASNHLQSFRAQETGIWHVFNGFSRTMNSEQGQTKEKGCVSKTATYLWLYSVSDLTQVITPFLQLPDLKRWDRGVGEHFIVFTARLYHLLNYAGNTINKWILIPSLGRKLTKKVKNYTVEADLLMIQILDLVYRDC